MIMMPVAVSGPALETVMVKTTLSPMFGAALLTVLVTLKSAEPNAGGVTVTEA